MATYFVKNGGSDGADGLSDANAWATCSKVSGFAFAAGDIIKFRRGDMWREQLTVSTSGASTSVPITYTTYGAVIAPPIINGADVVSSWTDAGSNIWTATLSTQPQLVMFNNVLGIPEASQGALNAPTEWFWSASVLSVFATSNPNSFYGTVEAAVRPTDDEALININGKNFIVIDGLTVLHSNDVGIKNYAATAGQSGRTIKNCRVAYCADGGICIFGDNHFFSATSIQNNEVAYTNLRNAGNGDGALEGITVMKADGYDISYNTVHHCVEEGIDSHGQSRNGRIHHNEVHTQIGTIQFRPAIYADGGDNVEVDHNVSHGYTNNLCKGLQLNCENASHTSNNMRYHHNIVYDCQTGFEIANSGGGTGHSNVKVYHNVFHQCLQYGVLMNSDILNKLSGVNEIKNNIFNESGNNDIIDFTTGNYGIANFTIDKNFFVTGTPSESQGTNPVIANDPLFTFTIEGGSPRDFILDSTSPCRNVGIVIPGINDGYFEAAPDLGAVEFQPNVAAGPRSSVTMG